MTLPQFVGTYGYWAVLGGTLVEAETVLLLAGFAAHRGYLDLPLVAVVAVAGSFLANQPFFFWGRYKGIDYLNRHPRFGERVNLAQRKLEKYQTAVILGVRFLVGLRMVIPFALGMTNISTSRFEVLNLAGAFVWSLTIAAGGYAFGHLFERALGNLRLYEEILFAVLAVGGLAYWWYGRRRT